MMRDRSGLWSLILILFAGCATSRPVSISAKPEPATVTRAESDQLSNLGDAARDKKSSPEHKPKRDHESKRHEKSSCSSCNDSPCTCKSKDGSNSILGPIFFGALISPFTIPIEILKDDYDKTTAFADYPYADDFPGTLVHGEPFDEAAKKWAGTLQAFAIPETDNIDRFGGRLVLESWRLGIDTETNSWIQTGSGGTNHLWTGDANLVFRFAESEKVQFRAGVGVNWLADSHGAEGGFNFTYGVDWFPRRPWTVATVFDVGTIGGGSLFHNRTTAGVMLGPVEAFAGYDYFQLGSASFHGPVAGLGWRF